MSSTKIYQFNNIQLRLTNHLTMSGSLGLRTDVLAAKVGITPSEVAFDLLKLREHGFVSTVNDGSAYVTWYSSPGLKDALRKYVESTLQRPEPTPKKHTYLVLGLPGSRYMPRTFVKESDAINEATTRAKNEPGRAIEIYVHHKTVVQKPEQRIPGELIIE